MPQIYLTNQVSNTNEQKLMENKKTRRSDCQLFVARECHVVSVTDPYGRILGFLDRSRYFSVK
jgi:hypothetical protein